MIRTISEHDDLRGKRVLLRSSLNVPMQNGVLEEEVRLQKALPTMQLLHEQGAKTIVISHLSEGPAASLRPVFDYLQKHIPLTFADDIFSLSELKDGDVVLCENIRKYPQEERNDPEFAARLAALADIFVQDDFTVLHREHASVVRLPKLLPSFMGLQCASEVGHLSQAFDPLHPALLIVGGAKPETKIPLIEKLAPRMDTTFIGGISANTILKNKGVEVGTSIIAEHDVSLRSTIDVLLPIDALVENVEAGTRAVKKIADIAPNEIIRDAGPDTVALIGELIKKSAFVLWNGPLGDYEKGFYDATLGVARAIATSSARSIVGGGDTIASLSKENILDKFSFVSTAGGAMIEFLTLGTLPGLEALKE